MWGPEKKGGDQPKKRGGLSPHPLDPPMCTPRNILDFFSIDGPGFISSSVHVFEFSGTLSSGGSRGGGGGVGGAGGERPPFQKK